MKILWLVSFRPIGKSKSNDLFQSIFVDSVKSLDRDVYFSLTQFDEANVKKFVKQKKIKNFYKNISKKKLPKGKKYSNKYMPKAPQGSLEYPKLHVRSHPSFGPLLCL